MAVRAALMAAGSCRGVLAAGARHRVTSAAAAADLRRRDLDDLAGAHAALRPAPARRWPPGRPGPRRRCPSTIAASPSLPLSRSASSSSAWPSATSTAAVRIAGAAASAVADGDQLVDVDGAVARRRRAWRRARARARARRASAPSRGPAPAAPADARRRRASSRSCSRNRSIASGPVIASIRRTLAALEVSVTIRNRPISAVLCDVGAAAQLA